MSMDTRKLLYKSKQMSQARQNALIAIDTLEDRDRRYRNDLNWFIRGSVPSDRTANVVISEEDTVSKIEYLRWIVRELNVIIDAISRAAATLNPELHELIKLRYFDDGSVTAVTMKMGISESAYNHKHGIALKAMTACLNPLCITEEHLDALLFEPYKKRLDALGHPKSREYRGKIKGFTAS